MTTDPQSLLAPLLAPLQARLDQAGARVSFLGSALLEIVFTAPGVERFGCFHPDAGPEGTILLLTVNDQPGPLKTVIPSLLRAESTDRSCPVQLQISHPLLEVLGLPYTHVRYHDEGQGMLFSDGQVVPYLECTERDFHLPGLYGESNDNESEHWVSIDNYLTFCSPLRGWTRGTPLRGQSTPGLIPWLRGDELVIGNCKIDRAELYAQLKDRTYPLT